MTIGLCVLGECPRPLDGHHATISLMDGCLEREEKTDYSVGFSIIFIVFEHISVDVSV